MRWRKESNQQATKEQGTGFQVKQLVFEFIKVPANVTPHYFCFESPRLFGDRQILTNTHTKHIHQQSHFHWDTSVWQVLHLKLCRKSPDGAEHARQVCKTAQLAFVRVIIPLKRRAKLALTAGRRWRNLWWKRRLTTLLTKSEIGHRVDTMVEHAKGLMDGYALQPLIRNRIALFAVALTIPNLDP